MNNMRVNEPINHGNIHVKSRIVFPPMATQSSDSGVPTDKTIQHYIAIAQNPLVGLIITEHSYIDQQGRASLNQLSFASDEVIPHQKVLTETIHRINPDIKIFAQISHAGANTTGKITDQPLVSASPVQMKGGVARALTISEIHQIEREFAQAALRVKKAGYDGVEIHSAHGYLLNEFYSTLTNFRTDLYGRQNMENRTRFLRETIREVRNAVGDTFPISVRLGGSDYQPGGSTLEDAAQAASLLEKEGVDLIDLSGGMNGFMRKDQHSFGWFSDMSSVVEQNVSVPVMVTGGITSMDQAEQLLKEGKADLIGVGRALFKNPYWGMEK